MFGISNISIGNLALFLVLQLGLFAEELFSVLVQEEFLDLNVGGVDGDFNSSTVGLFNSDAIDENSELHTENTLHFAFLSSVFANHNLDFVTLSNGNSANLQMLISKF